MSVVDQQIVHPSSSSTKLDPSPSSSPSPTILTLDFSTNPILRQVTTLLRRVWLLDPPLSDEELADPTTVGQCLQSVTQLVGGEFSFSSSSSDHESSSTKKWEEEKDDEEWKTRTQFRLLSHPVVLSAEKETLVHQQQQQQQQGQEQKGEQEDNYYLKSVVSPWREEIYDVYRHVFADLWRMVVTTLSSSSSSPNDDDGHQLAVFEPTRGNAVSVAALPACAPPQQDNTMTTSFPTDTFLYPVWVSPQANVTFLVQGEEGEEKKKHCWVVGEAKTWTTGLWVKAGQGIVLRTERTDGAGEEEEGTGLAAVFVTGHCDERKD